jgi:hypothetical protein
MGWRWLLGVKKHFRQEAKGWLGVLDHSIKIAKSEEAQPCATLERVQQIQVLIWQIAI